MAQVCIKIFNKEGKNLAVSRGEEEANLVYSAEYEEGDRIGLEVSEIPAFYWLQLDDAKGGSLVYLTGNVDYVIPFGEKRINLSPKVFHGKKHLLSVRKARPFEYQGYRNLSKNVNDQHGAANCFPHASANVETRGESVFAAMNAIDGVTVTSCHGEWPYESWGINQRADAVWKLDFGRMVEVDRIIFYSRADFPHDNWWRKGSVTFSDGSTMVLDLKKIGTSQEFTFEKKKISWLELGDLIKSEEPSPFPALVQLEVYGTEAEIAE